MDEIFGPSGLLAQKITFYEHRPEQNQMAKAVSEALAQQMPNRSSRCYAAPRCR
jgi:hypothetical protein